MASKKGVALTVGIAAAIVGSSFLIWYIPQSNTGAFIDAPLTDGEIISDVYSRHNDLAADVDLSFERWINNDFAADEMLALLATAKSQTGEMLQNLERRQPSQEWQESYDIYTQALNAFMTYLDELELKVESGDRNGPDSELRQEWQELVDRSVAAMPINN